MLLKKRKKYIEILSQHYSADPPFDLSFQQNLIAPPGLCSECHRWINTFCPWIVHTGTKEAGICSPWEGRLTRLGDGTLKARTSERSCFLVLLLLSREHFKIWWKSRGENKIFNNIIGIFLQSTYIYTYMYVYMYMYVYTYICMCIYMYVCNIYIT